MKKDIAAIFVPFPWHTLERFQDGWHIRAHSTRHGTIYICRDTRLGMKISHWGGASGDY